MASTKPTESAGDAPATAKQNETCSNCGKPMAADQRYCLECGQRRANPRVPFTQHLFGGEASDNGVARAPAAAGRQWNPLAVAALIALLGIMLLVGVLIGKDENDDPAPSPTAPAGQSATPTTPTTPTTSTPAIPPASTTPAPAAPGGAGATPGGANATPTTPAPGGAESETPPVPTSKEGATGQ